MYELKLKDFDYGIKDNNLIFEKLLNKNEKDIKLLDKYTIDGKDYVVNEIGERAFEFLNISNIELPYTIEKIRNSAFLNSGIEKFTCPPLVTEIPDNCFLGCLYLTDVVLHDEIVKISGYAFGKTGIAKFIFPPLVTEIPDCCFWCCGKLAEVVLHDDINQIGNSAFFESGIESFKLPSKVTEIPEKCFNYCIKLKKINLSNIRFVGKNAFSGCNTFNISFQNNKDIYIDDYDKLKEKGFIDAQINQIFKGYKNQIYLNDLPNYIPVDILRSIVKNFDSDPLAFYDIMEKLNDEDINLTRNIDLYKQINELSDYYYNKKEPEIII